MSQSAESHPMPQLEQSSGEDYARQVADLSRYYRVPPETLKRYGIALLLVAKEESEQKGTSYVPVVLSQDGADVITFPSPRAAHEAGEI
jgi:hypothetical protein